MSRSGTRRTMRLTNKLAIGLGFAVGYMLVT